VTVVRVIDVGINAALQSRVRITTFVGHGRLTSKMVVNFRGSTYGC
jgi:hypothetical protein